jgi:hypothetical protein
MFNSETSIPDIIVNGAITPAVDGSVWILMLLVSCQMQDAHSFYCIHKGRFSLPSLSLSLSVL